MQLCSQIWNNLVSAFAVACQHKKNTTCECRCYGWTNWASTFFWVIPCGHDMTKRTSYNWFMCQTILENFNVQPYNNGGIWWHNYMKYWATSQKLRGSISNGVNLILQVALWPWDQLSLKQKWVPGIFPGGVGKGGRLVELTTLWLSCADCFEVWDPQPSPGIYRDCYIFTYRMMALGWILELNSWQG